MNGWVMNDTITAQSKHALLEFSKEIYILKQDVNFINVFKAAAKSP